MTPQALKAILSDSVWALVTSYGDSPFAYFALLDMAENMFLPPPYHARVYDSEGKPHPAAFFLNVRESQVKELVKHTKSELYITPGGMCIRGKNHKLTPESLKVGIPDDFTNEFFIVTPWKSGQHKPRELDMSTVVAFSFKFTDEVDHSPPSLKEDKCDSP